MRCLDCKIVKYDGKWICPAHPYAEIDLYSVHRNCGANRWYPHYVRDRIECERVKYQNYETYALILSRAIEDGVKYHLQEELQAELEALYSRAQLNMQSSAIEFEKLNNELERLKNNGLV